MGAATWTVATTAAIILAARTPPDTLSLARQGSPPAAVQRDALATAAPAVVGIGGLIVLIAFAIRVVLVRRHPLLALPVVFRALRADGGVVLVGASGLAMLQLIRTVTENGTVASDDLLTAARILAGGFAVSGVLVIIGVMRGFGHEDPHYVPQFVGAVGIAAAGVLGLVVSETDNLTAVMVSAAVAALTGAFASLVLSVRNLARHEREHPPDAA